MDADDAKFVQQFYKECNAMWADADVQKEMGKLWLPEVNNITYSADKDGPYILVMHDKGPKPKLPDTIKTYRVKAVEFSFDF